MWVNACEWSCWARRASPCPSSAWRERWSKPVKTRAAIGLSSRESVILRLVGATFVEDFSPGLPG
ncbi:hypothetical protein DIPPA_03855 [Diplonema papillatum]|nr:hypothetical protein DIPPA_03855 [Diplonema papillatum]